MSNKSDNLNTLLSFFENDEVKNKLYQSEDRIRRSFRTLFGGYDLKAEDILNEVVKVENYNGLVIVKDINFYSYCEHHFAPFFGTANVYYQPNEIITGLGKVVRLVHDLHARKLQIQELMTKEIAQDITRVLKAKGVYVETKAKHLCICSRGVGDHNAFTICNYGEGTLKDKVFNIE
jgi:GTP cyclohydrolase IA